MPSISGRVGVPAVLLGALLAALLLVSFLLVPRVAIGAESSPALSDASPTTLTIGTTGDLVSANPFKSGTYSAYEMFMLNYDMLYGFSTQDLSPVSNLAEWPPTHSKDGKTWTFKIRSGVTWSDGEPLTARDIAFTYNFINEKHMALLSYALGNPIAKDAFEAPDDTTLVWHMEEPSLAPESPPYIPILPEHIWKRFWGTDPAKIKEFRNVPAVGSGPFVLTEWEAEQSWTFEANPHYWGPKPAIDRVVFRVFANPESMTLALKTGEVDAVEELPAGLFRSLVGQPNITTLKANQGIWDSLAFNLAGSGDLALRNVDVRLAIASAIDKQALVDRVLLGNGSVGSSILLPTFPAYRWEPTGEEIIPFDPGAAKEQLDAAGYKDRDGDGKRETPSGDPWSLEVLSLSDVPNSTPEAKLIVGWMKEAGIDTTLKTVSTSKAYDLWGEQDFDMYVWNWDTDVDPDFILSILTTKQCLGWSDGCYSNPEYDKLYEAQGSTIDQEERKADIIKMQQIAYADAPLIVLLYQNNLQAFRTDRFTGWVNSPAPSGSVIYTWNPATYLQLRPVASSAIAPSGSTGIPIWAWGLVALAVVVLLIALSRRRGSSEHQE